MNRRKQKIMENEYIGAGDFASAQDTNKLNANAVGACIARPQIDKSNTKGITLIALIITILFSYDEKLKCSNSKGFLLQTL